MSDIERRRERVETTVSFEISGEQYTMFVEGIFKIVISFLIVLGAATPVERV